MLRIALAIMAVTMALSLWFGYNVFSIWRYSSSHCKAHVGAILIMGAAEYNGVPSKVLTARADSAAKLYQMGVARYVVSLGGSRKGDVYSEAEVARAELVREKVPSADAFASSYGQDTYQSIAGVLPLLRSLDVSKVVVVSDGFHLYRSVHIAQGLGLWACGYADEYSPIKGWLSIRYMLREALAVTGAQVIGYKEESILRHGQD
jgi:vancomycin permeability regulator SanA